MEVPKDQMTLLIENGLHESAQMLGGFLASSSASVESSHIKAENMMLLGDALFGGKEFRRAMGMYKQALQHCKLNPKQNATNSRSSSTTRSSSPNSSNVLFFNENEVKFKITLCCCALGDNRAALAEMEGIPSKARSLKMNITMAKLYRISRHNRAAIACYRDCLRQCPYVLEAIVALAELGLSAKDILPLFPQTPNKAGRFSSDHLTSRWLQRYVEAQCCVASNDYRGGFALFSELLHRSPNNVHLLLEIAKVESICGRYDEAIISFEKARLIDPFIITYMDEYAMLLRMKSDFSKLSKLVHDLLDINFERAEVFVALSVFWQRKDERRALAYAEKALQIDDRHIPAYIMKGNLYLSRNRPDAAVTSFRIAHELRHDFRTYQGLVRSYLSLSKTKEALYVARDAMKGTPQLQSAKALKLVGDVHASISSGREKAQKFYESALRLESGYLGAAVALAELHVTEGRTEDAISLLQNYVKERADDLLHIKLAQIFAEINLLSEALSHYQSALRINSQNEVAKKGLERLEKLMKGVDPDAPEEDDNEDDDAEGEQEEPEIL